MITKTRKLFRKIFGNEYKLVDGSRIPAKDLRWCGKEFHNDMFYLKSADSEASRLKDNLGCTGQSRVLDVGCGQGRIAIGLTRAFEKLDYTGVDVHASSVDWCARNIGEFHPSFKFVHLDMANERYNQKGNALAEGFKFPFPDSAFDIAFLYSVFSHMTVEDMRIYMDEFGRVLNDGGKIFFTAFVEENVPDVSLNPDGYVFSKCSGPLHVVRYDKKFLFNEIEMRGFTVFDFSHGEAADGQSALYLVKK